MRDRINGEFGKIDEWLKRNKLRLNVGKTKVMVIRHSSVAAPLNIVSVDGQDLEIVNQMKYLGIMIDNKLDLKENVEYVCKKVANKVGVLSRLANNLTMGARITTYKKIIAPHFDCCAKLLFLSDQTTFERLQKLQNRAMRAVLKCRELTPISFMLSALYVKQRVYSTTPPFILQTTAWLASAIS